MDCLKYDEPSPDALMQFGVTLPGSGLLADPDSLRELAIEAEGLGFDSVWVADHVALPAEPRSRYPYSDDGHVPWGDGEQWLAPLLALTWIGAVTKTVHLGVSILVLPLREPILTAKDAATLDVLTGGRLVLGVGTGWLREEFEILGRQFDGRFEQTDQAIRVMRACWELEPVELPTDARRTQPFSMRPKPSRIPIWGGGSSDRALGLAVAACDGWHPSNLSPEEWGQRADVLRRSLEAAGRGEDDVTLTVRPGRTRVIDPDLVRAYNAAGVEVIVAELDYRVVESVPDARKGMQRLARSLGVG